MRFTPDDAQKHTDKATCEAAQRGWARIANAVLDVQHDEARAIDDANNFVARGAWKKKRTPSPDSVLQPKKTEEEADDAVDSR